jgi:hypothetical protein
MVAHTAPNVMPPLAISRHRTGFQNERSRRSAGREPRLGVCASSDKKGSAVVPRHVDTGRAIARRPLAHRHGPEQIVPHAEDPAVIAVVAGAIGPMMETRGGLPRSGREFSEGPFEIGVCERRPRAPLLARLAFLPVGNTYLSNVKENRAQWLHSSAAPLAEFGLTPGLSRLWVSSIPAIARQLRQRGRRARRKSQPRSAQVR